MVPTNPRAWRLSMSALVLVTALSLSGCTSPPATDRDADAADPVVEVPVDEAPIDEAPTEGEPAPVDPANPVLPESDGSSPYGIWTAPNGSSAYLLEDGSCSGMYYNAGQPLDIGGPMTCVVDGTTLLVRQPPNQVTYTIAVTSSTLNFISGGQLITFSR